MPTNNIYFFHEKKITIKRVTCTVWTTSHIINLQATVEDKQQNNIPLLTPLFIYFDEFAHNACANPIVFRGYSPIEA